MKKFPFFPTKILSLTALTLFTATTTHALEIPQSELSQEDADRAYAAVLANDASLDFATCVIANVEARTDDETKFDFILYTSQTKGIEAQGDIVCETSDSESVQEEVLTAETVDQEVYAMVGGGKGPGAQHQGGKRPSGKTRIHYYKPARKIITYSRPAVMSPAARRQSNLECNPFARHHIKHFKSKPSKHHKTKRPSKKPSGKVSRPSKQ